MNDANSQKKATLRLNHYIAACGQCSRRDADRLIEEGRVEVNGSPGQLGQIVTPTDVVTLDGRKLTPLMIHSSYLYYKPRGIVCTSKDPHAKLTITEELRRLKLPSNLTYAGRLDKESEGVLLLTNDGALVERVSHSAHGHEKEYLVEVDRKISGDSIRRIREGVYLPELARRTSPCLAACPLAIDIPALTELEPPELRNSLAKAAE
ncbi:MAG: rRNA pseudouridine synthase, partial [Butyrivibrio sp.]|nr:rRNA pseudouridine synthase [Butyrivibrio sp.]